MQWKRFILFLFPAFFILACNVEQKIAEEYVDHRDTVSLLILEPEYCYMINKNPSQITDFDRYSSEEKDSLLYINSNYVRYIDENIIRYIYLDSLFIELQKIGFLVYNEESLLPIMSAGEHAYLLNIAQMQLLEDLETDVTSEVFDSLEHFVETPIQRIDFDVWIEVSEMNAEKNMPMQVLYSSESIYDALSIRFYKKFLTQEVLFEKDYKPISFKQIHALVQDEAKKHAQEIYNLLLNEYIEDHLPDNRKRSAFYYYDFEKDIIRKRDSSIFIVL